MFIGKICLSILLAIPVRSDFSLAGLAPKLLSTWYSVQAPVSVFIHCAPFVRESS
jgi:hypothetical protein